MPDDTHKAFNILSYPLLTHSLLAALYLAIIGSALTLAGVHTPFILAAVIVTAFFYGREAGQREHDIKKEVGPIRAWLGSLLMFEWSLSNALEWLCPAVTVAVITVLLQLFGG